MRNKIAWFEKLPLFGRRIGITRPAAQAEPVIRNVLELGAQPVLMPTIEILPPDDWSEVDAAIARLNEIHWLVFTSANGVGSFLGRLWQLGYDARTLGSVRLAVIGSATAEELAKFRLKADVVPESFRAETLADALVPHVAGQRVLWPRASRGRDVLPQRLQAAGAQVEELVVYQNVDVDGLPESELAMIENGQLDWIGLSSPSIARNLHNLLSPSAMKQIGRTVRLASISPVTSAAAAEIGLPIAAEATVYTWDGILGAIIQADCRQPTTR
jgi:uroporphyrinogen III methyltransferase/synthase